MTIKQIYELAIKMGIDADLRPNHGVYRRLKQEKERYADLRPEEKKEYDLERLTNPYADTRVFAVDPQKQIKRILAGIDIDGAEVLLAQELSKKKPIDLIFSHHPVGAALAGMHEVMQMQAELFALLGVPVHLAEGLMKSRIAEVSRSLSPINHYQMLDTARILGFPVICIHTPCDNLVHRFLWKLMNKKNLEFVKDVLKILKTIPEYQEATKRKSGPVLFTGAPENYCGKIALTEMTGGTSGAKEIYEKLSEAGYGTLIGMHMKEESKAEAEKHHLNIIIAGHIASDSLGVNLFLDELGKKGIEVIPCSGLIRVKRFGRRKK